MAATVDATSAPTAAQQAPYAWKVPKGGERSQNATCYWAGAWMAHEMKGMSTATLKPVPKSEIRDGSVPLVHAVTDALEENWEDVPHVAGRAPEVAHINHPKEGEVIGDSFTCHFVDPRTRPNDQCIRLVFKPKCTALVPSSSQQSLPFIELQMFGNHYKGSVARPEGLLPGPYTLAIQMIMGDEYLNKAEVEVNVV